MSISLYVADFGEPIGMVDRFHEGHTVIGVDVRLTPRQVALMVVRLLTDEELREWLPVRELGTLAPSR